MIEEIQIPNDGSQAPSGRVHPLVVPLATPLTDREQYREAGGYDANPWALCRKLERIVGRLAEWSRKYPRQQVHSFSAQVDEQLIAIEDEAKALFDGHNDRTERPAGGALSTAQKTL
jgi:hypothetical protein